MQIPKISILIPCYNAEQWIAQAIESALNQTYPNKEVIVVDDGFTDASLGIIKSFGDRIRWETQTNQGGNATRNRLLELSTGEWLQYLDADDKLFPDKIASQVEYLSKASSVDILYGPVTVEYWEGNTCRSVYYPIKQPHDPWLLLIQWQLPQTGSPIWRKESVTSVGGWKADQPCCQEHELYLRLLMAGKSFRYYEMPGCIYRWWNKESVCRKDVFQTYRQRLKILNAAETHLRSTFKLNDTYIHALNQARFQIARAIWHFDSSLATKLIHSIHQTNPEFKPSDVPTIYQFTYAVFGFPIAETIAQIRRSLFAHQPNPNAHPVQ